LDDDPVGVDDAQIEQPKRNLEWVLYFPFANIY
jgi:hypothetical protein